MKETRGTCGICQTELETMSNYIELHLNSGLGSKYIKSGVCHLCGEFLQYLIIRGGGRKRKHDS